jgi:exopolysaccharide biosynthesis polyprenyl glycosylphosphotransferase
MTQHPTFKLVFLGIDIAIITFSYYFALSCCVPHFWVLGQEPLFFYVSHFSMYLIALTVFLFSMRYNNLYRRNIIILRYRQFILILKSILAASLVIALFMILSNMDYFASMGKQQILYFAGTSLLLFTLLRAATARKIYEVLASKNISQINVLIVGGDITGCDVADSLLKDEFADFKIMGFLDDYKPKGADIYAGYTNLGQLEDIDEIMQTHEVHEILVAIDNAPYTRLIQIVKICVATGKPVRIHSNLLKVVAEKLDVEYYASIPLVSLPTTPVQRTVWQDKRIVDVVLSVVVLILLAPLFLVIAVAIKLSSPGPVIYKQNRIGKNGKPFHFYKFRSMHLNNDASRHEEYVTNFIKQKNNGCSTAEIPAFKITDDPRIFRFGRFIRKTSLDEFPQLFNVLRGEMSLVGPRPCLAYEWDCYEEWHKQRLDVTPGCTGLWQALGRSAVTFEEMVILDLYYTSNLTLWLDLKIIINTFPVIFLGKGGF